MSIHKSRLRTEEKRRVGKDIFIRNDLKTEGDKARYFIKKI